MTTLQVIIINELYTVLQSIYGDDSIRLWQYSGLGLDTQVLSPIRYEVHVKYDPSSTP
jgi:hypothetical protein